MAYKQKYNLIENDLQKINRDCIALPEDEVKRNNRILEDVVPDQIIPKMIQINNLFEFLLFSERPIFYAGSFFCDLKVGHPDEYDLVFLMEVPEYAQPILTITNIPGFVQIQLEGMKQWEKRPEEPKFMSKFENRNSNQNTAMPKRKPKPNHQKIRVRSRKIQSLWDNIRYNKNLPLTKEERIILSGLANLIDDDYYLDTTKVSGWIEGVIQKTYDDLEKCGKFTFIKTSEGTFKAELEKSGPAFTLKLRGKSNHEPVIIDIDLVPGFVFTSEQWPPRPFRQNPVPDKPQFFIVPKKPNKNGDFTRYWRPSFQEQERVLIKDVQNLKPCLRLLKRLRDVCNHKSIASYHIKTIFLWELEENEGLFRESLSYVFIKMLEKCRHIFENGEILNYWNRRDNLIKGLDRRTLDNIANNFKRIILDIKRNPNSVIRHLDGRNNRNHH